jgi:hypothetical protein
MIKITVDKLSELYYIYNLISNGELNGSYLVKQFKELKIPTKQVVTYEKSKNFEKDIDLDDQDK